MAGRVGPRGESGASRLAAETRFPLEQVADAHRRLESGQNIGKVILTVS